MTQSLDILSALKLLTGAACGLDGKGFYCIGTGDANKDRAIFVRELRDPQVGYQRHMLNAEESKHLDVPEGSVRYTLTDVNRDAPRLLALAGKKLVAALNTLTAELGDGIEWEQEGDDILFKGSAFEVDAVHGFSQAKKLDIHLESRGVSGTQLRSTLQPGFDAAKIMALAAEKTKEVCTCGGCSACEKMNAAPSVIDTAARVALGNIEAGLQKTAQGCGFGSGSSLNM